MSTPAAPISIVVAYYDDVQSATAAVRMLEQRVTGMDMLDAGVLRMAEAGWRLEIAATAQADGGGLLRSIFSPEILALRSVGTDASTASAHFRDLGFDANLLKEIGENLPPGGAAIVAVIAEKWLTAFSDLIASKQEIARFARRADVSFTTATDAPELSGGEE